MEVRAKANDSSAGEIPVWPNGSHLKRIASIFLVAALFCACSRTHIAHVDESIHIDAGTNIVAPDYIVIVQKRDGHSLQGIRVLHKESDGKNTIITAATGTVTEGPIQTIEADPKNVRSRERVKVIVLQNTVKMTLFNANVQTKTPSSTNRMTATHLELNF